MTLRSASTSLTVLPALSLSRREIVRFLRQRSRVFGALGQPLLFWLLLGSGLGPSFTPAGTPAGMTYLEYFFPGTILLILLFSSIFTNISVIDDRKEGFLQSVLVAPISSPALVAGKVIGGAGLALLQAVIFLLLAPTIGIELTIQSFVYSVLVLSVIALAMTSLGFAIAWRMDSTQGFHVIMNVFLIPSWLLSGAFFPAAGTPLPLYWTIMINPVRYCLTSLQHAVYPAEIANQMDLPSAAISFAIMTLFAVIMFGVALWMRKNHRVV